jgi:formylglycine-generating enzyme required for sulfatase activity
MRSCFRVVEGRLPLHAGHDHSADTGVAATAIAATPAVVTTAIATTAMEFVTVGNPGNADAPADDSGVRYGGVSYEYRIGKYEVTYGQYLEFLNAKAKSDPTGLYDPDMTNDQIANGIQRNGSSGSYIYSLLNERSANLPVAFVNFTDAARFANWVNNGKGNASTENGAYLITTANVKAATRANGVNTYQIEGNSPILKGDQIEVSGLLGIGFAIRSQVENVEYKGGSTYVSVKNSYPDNVASGEGVIVSIPSTRSTLAKVWIPSEDEWTKAAYYNPKLNNGAGGYYEWATQSNDYPGNSFEPIANQANIPSSDGSKLANTTTSRDITPITGPSLLTPVGSFSKSPSYYGTYDQDGNLTEWTDTVYDATAAFGSYNRSPNATRSKHGAMYYSGVAGSTRRDDILMPNDKGYGTGFRLAASVSASSLVNSSADCDCCGESTHNDASHNHTSDSTKATTASTTIRSKLVGPAIFGGTIQATQELWAVDYPARGKAKITLNADQTYIDYEFKVMGLDFGIIAGIGPITAYTGDDVNGMHIHHAKIGAVGDPALGIISPNQDLNSVFGHQTIAEDTVYSYDKILGEWTITGRWSKDDPSSVSFDYNLDNYLFQGLDYINIHNEDVVLGVIRGQLLPMNDVAQAGPPLLNQRLINPISGKHFYSSNSKEIASLTSNGWKQEGFAWNLYAEASSESDLVPDAISGQVKYEFANVYNDVSLDPLLNVHRLYNSSSGDHFFTTNNQELLAAQRVGYAYEGVVGRAYSPSVAASNGFTVVQRLYNGLTGEHLYTSSSTEVASLLRLGYSSEGAAWAS